MKPSESSSEPSTRITTKKGPCKYGDPFCPCQDGDQCHYEGINPMKPPNEYQSCPKCGTRWLANETLPCPSCNAAPPAQPARMSAQAWHESSPCPFCVDVTDIS